MTLVISDVAGDEAAEGFTVKATGPNWPWWWSNDQERYTGPNASRADAIMDAWSNGETGFIHIIQARHDELNCKIYSGSEIADAFDGANEEAQDSEGNTLSSEIPDDRWDKIAASVNHQILTAVREKGVTAWGFSVRTEGEHFDLSGPRTAMLPAETRVLFAEIAEGYDPRHGFAETYIDTQVARLKAILAPKPTPPEGA